MKKLGLVLGSGGGRGVFHLGVLKALQENKIYPEIVVGSSIGALVGGLWCVYQDFEKILEVIKNDRILAIKSFLDPSLFSGGIIKGEALQKVISEILGEDEISELKVKFATVTCDLKTGKQWVWADGSLSMAIRSSMSIPGTFNPVHYKDMILADGGVVNPVPDDVAKDLGADVVIACNLDHRLNEVLEDSELNRVDKNTYRMLNIMRHYLAEYSLNKADIILNPNINDNGMLSLDLILDSNKKAQLIELGYKMMSEKIPELKTLLSS